MANNRERWLEKAKKLQALASCPNASEQEVASATKQLHAILAKVQY